MRGNWANLKKSGNTQWEKEALISLIRGDSIYARGLMFQLICNSVDLIFVTGLRMKVGADTRNITHASAM